MDQSGGEMSFCHHLDDWSTDEQLKHRLCYSRDRTDLFVGDGTLSLIGQLHARAHVRAQVGLAAYQQDLCAGAEVLDLRLPLFTYKRNRNQIKPRPRETSFNNEYCSNFVYNPDGKITGFFVRL